MPTMAQPRATRLRRPKRSPKKSALSRKAHPIPVYCKKTAAAAVVRVMAVTYNRFIEANEITNGTSMGRQRMCLGRTKNARTTAAERARKQAKSGPRFSCGMAASGGLLTNAPLVLHRRAAATTIARPRGKVVLVDSMFGSPIVSPTDR